MYWAEERGQIIGSVGHFLAKRMRERRVYFSRSTNDKPSRFTSTRDKATRARSIQARMQMGMVYLPHGAPWTPDLLGELTRFTGEGDGIDDQVDVLSLFGRMLDGMHAGAPPAPRPEPTMTYENGQVMVTAASIMEQLRVMGEKTYGKFDG